MNIPLSTFLKIPRWFSQEKKLLLKRQPSRQDSDEKAGKKFTYTRETKFFARHTKNKFMSRTLLFSG